jgi:hypothetical protein
MTYPPGSDDPVHRPPGPGVRPFLRALKKDDTPLRPQSPGERTATLRPFVMTSGRTVAADPDIGLETQVTTRPNARPARLTPEMKAIVSLCHEPVSVAEISAQLRLHLGVTKILVGDLRAAGQLDVHVLDNHFPDPETIMRVISGLRALS